MAESLNVRKPEATIDGMFIDRWSPRAYLPDAISADQIRSLLEAARWAPSCYNEQPWFFIYTTSESVKQRFIPLLTEKNQKWAGKAPLLLFILAKRNFKLSGKRNRHAAFDAGAAWVSLAFEARKLGLYAHAMAGFDEKKSYEILSVSEDEYEVMAAIAIGKKGEPGQLPDDLQKAEMPNARKALSEMILEVK
jgi:nitroreductase